MTERAKFTSVDEYLAALSPGQRMGLDELRATVRAALPPDATEQLSYQIIGYKLRGKGVIWLAAFADHYSLYPYTDAMREQLGAELEPLLSGKGTIRLAADEPLPLDLVRRAVEARLAEMRR